MPFGAQAEEVADRSDDAGSLGIVPLHADEHLAVVFGITVFVAEAQVLWISIMATPELEYGMRPGPRTRRQVWTNHR